ncbi:MAG: hypothetical protein M0Z78_08945 [Betaproteobacteria bacterium]|nr:hypothetical protein [Betaproteobacteria bacterium]
MKKQILVGLGLIATITAAGCGNQSQPTDYNPKISLVRTTADSNEPVYPGSNYLSLRANAPGIVVATLLDSDSILSFDGESLRPTARVVDAATDAEISVYVPTAGCVSHSEQIRLDFIGNDGKDASKVESVQVVCN